MSLKIVQAGLPDESRRGHSSRGDPGEDIKSNKVITRISRQLKRPDRYSVYINNRYVFSLNETQLIEARLKVGMECGQEVLDSLKIESQFGKLYERTVNYIYIRPRSRKEVEEYLRRVLFYPKPKCIVARDGARQYVKQVVDTDLANNLLTRVVDRLEHKGYINDQVFAEQWIQMRLAGKKTSLKKLQLELRTKGISEDIIATILQNDNNPDLQTLKELIIKKRKFSRYAKQDKLVAYLMRLGFSYQDIALVMEETDNLNLL